MPLIAASIAVDVGHYLKEPGVISARGVTEFEYNLQLAREIEVALKHAGHRTILIGGDGLSEELSKRAPRASGMNLFISSYRFNKPMPEVIVATLPMLGILAIGVLLITYCPPLTTWLPRLFAGS